MKRLLPFLMGFALLLFSSTEGWSGLLTLDQAVNEAAKKLKENARDLQELRLGGIRYQDTGLQPEFARFLQDKLQSTLANLYSEGLSGGRIKVVEPELRWTGAGKSLQDKDLQDEMQTDSNFSYLLKGTYWVLEDSIELNLKLVNRKRHAVFWNGTMRIEETRGLAYRPTDDFEAFREYDGIGAFKFRLTSKKGKDPVYKIGENLELILRTGKKAWIYCYYFQADGKVIQILPNPYFKSPLFRGKIAYDFSNPKIAPFLLKIEPPAGRELLKCFAASRDITKELPKPLRGRTLKPLPKKSVDRLVASFRAIPRARISEASLVLTILNEEAAEVKLKMVTMLPSKHPVGKSFGGFIKRINAALKGEFQIDWRGGPEAVGQFKQPNAVRLGSVDATITSPSYVNGILNVSGASNYSNKTYAERKAAGFHDYFAKLHEAKGLVYVGELPMSNKSFHIFLRNPIKSLEDIKGLKIRVFPAIAPAVKALGANPIVLPMPAIYTSMERGVVKGFVTGIPGVAKIYKGVLGDWIHEGFYTAVFHFLVNPKSWAKIPAATRAKVLNYTRNVDPPIFEANWKPVIDAAYDAVEKAKLPGTKFSPAVTAKFSKIVYDAAWAAVKKAAPKEGAELEKLLMK